ncbi:hypothetical protein [Alicyclobacillus contaminans]|uniref:hypothetical protein n=1 Tax=Alicyclobacillus contaminans TaxID=392016 RepID=UPI0003F632EB|nr:hypothetical protein [Alicyclobacillus contaminans]
MELRPPYRAHVIHTTLDVICRQLQDLIHMVHGGLDRQANPAEALRRMVHDGAVVLQNGRYLPMSKRKHPDFPNVPDVVSFLSQSFREALNAVGVHL